MSRPKSYFHREQKIFTQEQMFAKLEQRVAQVSRSRSVVAPLITESVGSSEVEQREKAGDAVKYSGAAGSTPAPCAATSGEPVILEWGKPQSHKDGGYMMTTCARFTVVKERQKDGSWGYLPFRGKMSLKGYLSTVDEAKAICQQHA